MITLVDDTVVLLISVIYGRYTIQYEVKSPPDRLDLNLYVIGSRR